MRFLTSFNSKFKILLFMLILLITFPVTIANGKYQSQAGTERKISIVLSPVPNQKQSFYVDLENDSNMSLIIKSVEIILKLPQGVTTTITQALEKYSGNFNNLQTRSGFSYFGSNTTIDSNKTLRLAVITTQSSNNSSYEVSVEKATIGYFDSDVPSVVYGSPSITLNKSTPTLSPYAQCLKFCEQRNIFEAYSSDDSPSSDRFDLDTCRQDCSNNPLTTSSTPTPTSTPKPSPIPTSQKNPAVIQKGSGGYCDSGNNKCLKDLVCANSKCSVPTPTPIPPTPASAANKTCPSEASCRDRCTRGFTKVEGSCTLEDVDSEYSGVCCVKATLTATNTPTPTATPTTVQATPTPTTQPNNCFYDPREADFDNSGTVDIKDFNKVRDCLVNSPYYENTGDKKIFLVEEFMDWVKLVWKPAFLETLRK